VRIGVDFDNTIVNYNFLFHKIAFEQKLIDESVSQTKTAIRDYLREKNQENLWTEMQGYVYGARMMEAVAYPNVCDILRELTELGHTIAIISHKTKFPYLGEQYDLHLAAKQWIEKFLMQLIPEDQIFFELSKVDKINRIKSFHCDLFLDDLPEILLDENFPTNTKPILFNPENHSHNTKNLEVISSWGLLKSYYD
jgi:hypothetical protein